VSTPDSTSSQAFGISEIALGDGRVVVQLAGELDVSEARRASPTRSNGSPPTGSSARSISRG
jgi:hypothetical protein